MCFFDSTALSDAPEPLSCWNAVHPTCIAGVHCRHVCVCILRSGPLHAPAMHVCSHRAGLLQYIGLHPNQFMLALRAHMGIACSAGCNACVHVMHAGTTYSCGMLCPYDSKATAQPRRAWLFPSQPHQPFPPKLPQGSLVCASCSCNNHECAFIDDKPCMDSHNKPASTLAGATKASDAQSRAEKSEAISDAQRRSPPHPMQKLLATGRGRCRKCCCCYSRRAAAIQRYGHLCCAVLCRAVHAALCSNSMLQVRTVEQGYRSHGAAEAICWMRKAYSSPNWSAGLALPAAACGSGMLL